MKKDKWEEVGTIGVDAGLCWIGDPCYVISPEASFAPKTWREFCDKIDFKSYPTVEEPLGKDVGFAVSTGYGDGCYPVYVKRVDGRIAAVKVVFIEEEEEDE